MGIRVHLTQRPIGRGEIGFPLEPKKTGAIIEFFSVVRDEEEGERISAMEFESFREMAQYQMRVLAERLTKEHNLTDFECFHRIGNVPIGEPSLLVRIAATTREEATQAMTLYVDEVRRIIPIWKKPVKA